MLFPPMLRLLAIATCLTISFSLTQAQGGLHFDGVNDYVQTSFGGIQGTGSRTVEAWIKTPFVSGQEVITDWGTASTGGRFTFALIDGKLRVEVHGSGVTSNTVVGDNQWHHVAVTFNNNSAPKYRVYIDGQLENLFNISTPINTGSSVDLRIGLRVDGAKPWHGEMDEVRVWNYARSSTDIASYRHDEFCVLPSGLVAYYKLNEGIPGGNNSGVTTAPDLISNNNGILNGFSLSGNSSNWTAGYPVAIGSLTGVLSTTGCISYVSPSGNYVWTSSGTYIDTLTTVAGCDSILIVNLTMSNVSTGSANVTACGPYTSPSGNQVWTTSGTYTDTLIASNMNGCDSIVTINLTLNNTSNTLSASACDSYTSPSGNYTWGISGTYTDTLTNSLNCDSVLTINLTIHPSTQGQITASACGSYTAPSGNTTWTTSGVYFDTITNTAGCDSALIITLTIDQVAMTTVSDTACDSYTSPSGQYTWTNSGTYTDTLMSANGCDSVLTINLTILNTAFTITYLNNVLSSNSSGGPFQWVDCNDNYAPIAGATSQSFTPTVNGSYAVVVGNGNCIDTSTCVDVVNVGRDEVLALPDVRVYPNPTQGQLRIDPGSTSGNLQVDIFTPLGVKVYSTWVPSAHPIDLNLNEPTGLYLIHLSNGNGSRVVRLLLI